MQATTIKDLIKYLQDEDQDSVVIYQYYTADNFDTTNEVFEEVAYGYDSLIPCLNDAYESISNSVKRVEEE